MMKEPTEQEQPQQNVSEEQQEMYDIFVGQGTKLAMSAAKSLQGQTDPKVIGEAMFEIVDRVESEGMKNGMKFDLATMLHGSGNILSNLVHTAGIQLDENQTKEVVGHMVGKYLDNSVKTGKMTPEQVVQLGEQAKSQDADGLLQSAPVA